MENASCSVAVVGNNIIGLVHACIIMHEQLFLYFMFLQAQHVMIAFNVGLSFCSGQGFVV